MAPERCIRDGIAQRRLIRFTLLGCVRVAEPHDYGLRAGKRQLLVYQVGGQSNSGRLPQWRWVLVDKASGFELLDATFAGGRTVPSGRHVQWDSLFARVAPAQDT